MDDKEISIKIVLNKKHDSIETVFELFEILEDLKIFRLFPIEKYKTAKNIPQKIKKEKLIKVDEGWLNETKISVNNISIHFGLWTKEFNRQNAEEIYEKIKKDKILQQFSIQINSPSTVITISNNATKINNKVSIENIKCILSKYTPNQEGCAIKILTDQQLSINYFKAKNNIISLRFYEFCSFDKKERKYNKLIKKLVEFSNKVNPIIIYGGMSPLVTESSLEYYREIYYFCLEPKTPQKMGIHTVIKSFEYLTQKNEKIEEIKKILKKE